MIISFQATVKKSLQFLVNSDLIIGMLAASLLLVTKIIFSKSILFTSTELLIICLSVAGYNVSRLNGSKSKTRYLFLQTFLLFVLIICLILFFEIDNLILFFPAFLLWLLYSFPFSQKIIIRNNAFLKTAVISFVWTWITLIIPAYQYGVDNDLLLFHFLARFFFIGAISIANDLVDMKEDKKSNTNTFPVLLGKQKTLIIIMICMLMYLFFSFFANNLVPYFEIGFILTGLISSGIIILAYKVKEKSICKFIVDSSIICQMIIIAGIYFIN